MITELSRLIFIFYVLGKKTNLLSKRYQCLCLVAFQRNIESSPWPQKSLTSKKRLKILDLMPFYNVSLRTFKLLCQACKTTRNLFVLDTQLGIRKWIIIDDVMGFYMYMVCFILFEIKQKRFMWLSLFSFDSSIIASYHDTVF